MQGSRETPMRRTSRLFEIIQLLRSAKKPLTAAAIAETLEVTKRTVYRDVASLQAMSVPIYGEAGVGYASLAVATDKHSLSMAKLTFRLPSERTKLKPRSLGFGPPAP